MTSAAACATCWVMISIATGLTEHGQGDKFKLGALAVSFFFVSSPTSLFVGHVYAGRLFKYRLLGMNFD